MLSGAKNVPAFGLSWILTFSQQHFQGQIYPEVLNNRSCPLPSEEILCSAMKCSFIPSSTNLEYNFPNAVSWSLHSGHKTLQNVHPSWWGLDPFIQWGLSGPFRDIWLARCTLVLVSILGTESAKTNFLTKPVWNCAMLCFKPLGFEGCPKSLFHSNFHVSVMLPIIKWFLWMMHAAEVWKEIYRSSCWEVSSLE